MNYTQALAEAVIVGLKSHKFLIQDQEQWGIGVEFKSEYGNTIKGNAGWLLKFLDQEWVTEVIELQEANVKNMELNRVRTWESEGVHPWKILACKRQTPLEEYPNPQLRIQYLDNKFYVYLECFIGKYESKSGHKVKELSESNIAELLQSVIYSGLAIHDQRGVSIFP